MNQQSNSKPPFDYGDERPRLLGRARGEGAAYPDARLPALELVASVEVPGEMGSAKVQVFGHAGSGDRTGVVLRFSVCSEETEHDLVPHAELRADGVDVHLVTTWEAANVLQALAEALRISAQRTRATAAAAAQRASAAA